MAELEKIKGAKLYMDKLADGINPIDNTAVPKGDIVNSARLSQCFSFISDVLRQVIENGGVISSADGKEPGKPRVLLPCEEKERFPFSETPVTASEIARRLNALANHPGLKKITYTTIASWLSEIGALESVLLPSGKRAKRPSPKGEKLGITTEERMGPQGSYQVVVYDMQAQHFIIDNLDAILESEYTKTELQGTPWLQAHDDCLKDLYQKEVPLDEIAITLKRNKEAIRARLKKFGLLEKKPEG